VVIVGFTTMPTNHLPPIEDWQKKQLLVHIEEAGGLGVANFKTICDSKPAIFGGPGRDSIRRQFQKELSNCLKRNPRNYLKLLSDYNITPSEQAIARAETGLSNVIVFWFTFVAIVCSPFILAGGSAYSSTMGDSGDEEESTQGFISTMSSPGRSSLKNKSKKAPTSSNKRQSKIPTTVAYSDDDYDGLVASMAKTHMEDGDGANLANKTDGSAKFPFQLHVDPKRIGRTHPFFIVRIENQIVGKTTRNVWEILLMAEHPGEVDRYTAEVSGPSSITVTMPSVPGWLLDENKLRGHSCDTTQTQYQAWIADYLKRGNQSVRFLIHFPSGTMLDNALFGRDRQLEKEVLYMKDELVGSGGKIPIFASGLRWKIAELGLRDLQADEPATDVYGGFVAKYGFSP
jgi:hypothetical protein